MKNDVNIMRYVERNKQYHLTPPTYDTEMTEFGSSGIRLSSASGNNLKGDGRFKNIDENALF